MKLLNTELELINTSLAGLEIEKYSLSLVFYEKK